MLSPRPPSSGDCVNRSGQVRRYNAKAAFEIAAPVSKIEDPNWHGAAAPHEVRMEAGRIGGVGECAVLEMKKTFLERKKVGPCCRLPLVGPEPTGRVAK